VTDFVRMHEVSDELIADTYTRWVQLVNEQMERDVDELLLVRPWLFIESIEYLVTAALLTLGIRRPLRISLSLMDSLVNDSECDAIIVWAAQASDRLESYSICTDCTVVNFTDLPWPDREALLTSPYARSTYLRKLLYALGCIKSKLEVI
jgi:hypothetical protein